MALVRKTITITERQDAFIKSQIESGKYASDSEVVRDLLRRQEDYDKAQLKLKRLLDDGIASGISERSPRDILADFKAKRGLNDSAA